MNFYSEYLFRSLCSYGIGICNIIYVPYRIPYSYVRCKKMMDFFFPFLINSNIWVPFLMFSQVMHIIKTSNPNDNSQPRVHCLLVKAACMWSQDFFPSHSVLQKLLVVPHSMPLSLLPWISSYHRLSQHTSELTHLTAHFFSRSPKGVHRALGKSVVTSGCDQLLPVTFFHYNK